MTKKEMEIAIINLQNSVLALASRNYAGRSDKAIIEAKTSMAAADAASQKADGFENAITNLALAQEELITEIIPELVR